MYREEYYSVDWCGAFAMRFIHTVAAALPLCKQCIKHKTASSLKLAALLPMNVYSIAIHGSTT